MVDDSNELAMHSKAEAAGSARVAGETLKRFLASLPLQVVKRDRSANTAVLRLSDFKGLASVEIVEALEPLAILAFHPETYSAVLQCFRSILPEIVKHAERLGPGVCPVYTGENDQEDPVQLSLSESTLIALGNMYSHHPIIYRYSLFTPPPPRL